jgi:hypothetical protein
MKEKIYHFITTTNQILFFAFAIMMFVTFLLSLFQTSYTPEIKIINSKESNNSKRKVEEIIYEKVFSEHIKDTYVIELRSNQILQKSMNSSAGLGSFVPSSRIGYKDNKIPLINLLFTKKGESAHKLFAQDSYIKSFLLYKTTGFSEYSDKLKLEKNIYSVIKDDTNKDNILDSKDREDLYVSDYDGQNLALVTEDIVSYKLVEENQVLISKMLKNQTQLYIYDVLSKELTLLDTTVRQ